MSSPLAHLARLPAPDIVSFLCRALKGVEAKDFRVIETHMSWVFLAGDNAYKLKKATRSAYLDFSTTEYREQACRAEMRLNRRLAPAVYVRLAPIFMTSQGLSFAGPGIVVDWLVIMRRLDLTLTLDSVISSGRISPAIANRLAVILGRFYRGAPRCVLTPETYFRRWRGKLQENIAVLLDERFGLPKEALFQVQRALHRYLAECRDVIAARPATGMVREGHGDLRPEHIWLGTPISIIDSLEFNAELRQVDPLDELAYLQIECERLGAGWVGERIGALVQRALGSVDTEALSSFYRCYRASLRARLALAHLLDAQPRTPEKWAPLAQSYLRIADRNARQIEGHLANRKLAGFRAGFLSGLRPRLVH